jgi:hypothetical protein
METTRKQKMAARQKAQEMLMHGIGNVLGYWGENNSGELDAVEALGYTEEEFNGVIAAQADRVAKMFGYEKAWGN